MSELATATVPPGFEAVTRGGPFFMALAPVYRRISGQALVLGLHIDVKHANAHGNAHGGMLTTVADGALHDNLVRGRGPDARIVTVSMSVDFLSPARVGDWLEAHVTVTRQGRSLCFADCLLRVGERAVLRASAVFAQA
jgi:uncharacterized protein (TIGR00369 family)